MTLIRNIGLWRDPVEYHSGELIGLVLIPSLLAILVFYLLMQQEIKGMNKSRKWIAAIPLMIGAPLGVMPFYHFFFDTLYKEAYGGGMRSMLGHAGGLFGPILTAVGLFLWGRWHDRKGIADL